MITYSDIAVISNLAVITASLQVNFPGKNLSGKIQISNARGEWSGGEWREESGERRVEERIKDWE